MQSTLAIIIRFALVLVVAVVSNNLAFGQDRAPISRFPTQEWLAFASPEDAGFSSEKMAGLADDCKRSGAACVLVICDGAVLFHFGDLQTRFMCHSVRKSFLSMLYGIYVDGGSIHLERSLEDLGIDDIPPSLTADEKRARIVDLLCSRSGVYHPSAYEPAGMKRDRPARGEYPPGTHWWYNNWDFNALLTIFEQETGEQFFDAFHRRIAQPLGMEDFRLRDGYYHREPKRSQHPAYPFQMSARDMARIGLLMASGGRWGDRQIIPAEWVDVSTRPHSRIPNWHSFDGYGYLWWVRTSFGERLFSAQGNGGNSIDVLPNRKLVLVFRADTYRGKSINWAARWRIVEKVVRSQTGVPVRSPQLEPLSERQSSPAPVPLSKEYRSQFPLNLPRQLPGNLPPEIRDEPVRIDDVDGTLVLRTKRPPAMSFDLVPLAEDRFWIMDFGEFGVIERDPKYQPARFLLKNDLLSHAKELRAVGKMDAAAQEERLARELFPARLHDQ